MKTIAFAVAAIFAVVLSALAAPITTPAETPSLLHRVDWQAPEQLPPRLRNHCAYDVESGRP